MNDNDSLGVPSEAEVGLSAVSLPSVGDAAPIPRAGRVSVNDNIVIYPNKSGFDEIRKLIQARYRISTQEAREWVGRRTTSDGGYNDQMWSITAELHSMFFNGTSFFENTFVDFPGEAETPK